ncbi:MAG: hypothetical protein JW945_04910 [Methanomicrobia archaeon]|nr:hypothetical protein [Methanomicrobia archaeon]
MDKNIYLRKQEQMVFHALSPRDIVTTKELEGEFPQVSSAQLNKIVSQLCAKGYLRRLKRGVYLVQETPSKVPYIKNPYKVALALYNGYIGFSSALRIYQLLDYEPFTIFVVTVNKSREKKIGDYTVKAVAMGKRAVGITFHEGIYISTLAKTFFDCFYKPQYCGGYSAITKALYDVELDWDEFLTYFVAFASNSLWQRTGYVLALLKEETGKLIPGLERFRRHVKTNTKLVPSGTSSGRYNKGWMVLDNLGEENILSWWYYG